MQTARTTRSAMNALSGIVNRVITMLGPFIIRTIMIQKLGVEYLGLDNLFTSVLHTLSLSEMGFGTAVVYSMYKPVAEGDEQLICELLNFYKQVYRIVGGLILVIGLALLPNITLFIASDYPDSINIYIVYLIFLFNTVISYFMFAYKSSILTACLRSDVENNIMSLCNLIKYVFQIIILFATSNYYLYIILKPCFTTINNIIRNIVVNKKFPQYVAKGKLSKEVKKGLFSRVKALIGHRIAGVFFSSFDSLVISSFLGLAILGKYTNYLYIHSAINSIMLMAFQSVTAVIGNALVCKKPHENYATFQEIFCLNAWQSCFSSISLACLYQPFMIFWVGEDNLLPQTVAVLLGVYYYTINIRRVGMTYKDAAGMWQDDFWKPYVSALTNLVFNILLVKIFGLPGVIISSIVALVVVEIPWETRVLFRKCFKMRACDYYKRLFYTTFVWIIAFAGTYYLCGLTGNTIKDFVLKMLICIVVPNLIFIASFYKAQSFKNILKRLWRLFQNFVTLNKKELNEGRIK